VLEKWRRARDSNPQRPHGPVDFNTKHTPADASGGGLLDLGKWAGGSRS